MKKITSLISSILAILFFCGCSSESNGTTTITTVVPLAPTNLAGSNPETTRVLLSWTDNSTNETGFKIERKAGSGNYSTIGSANADITNFIDTGVIDNTSYTYRVYAYNSVGSSITYTNEFIIKAKLPTVTTTKVSNITYYSATSGGIVSNDGGAAITSRGICWCSCAEPTINDSHTNDGSGTGSFTSNISGFKFNDDVYVRAYATNSTGTSYGQAEFFPTWSAPLAIGRPYLGGIIAYIDATGLHGLIAAVSDQNTGSKWYNGTYITTGATATALDAGKTNTNTIVASQGTGSYAAKLCDDLVLGGYSDWYLPSKDQLTKLYLNKVAIGGFVSASYWSSSETTSNAAWGLTFNDGTAATYYKSSALNVRAVRTF
jgi:hypothetical protein